MPQLKELYTALKDKGFVIVGVHTNHDSDKMKAFVEKKKIDWPIVVDGKGDKSSKAFNVEGYPTTVLIDKSGKIVEVFLGGHPEKEQIEKLLKEDWKDEKKADEKKADKPDEKKAEDKKAEDKKD